MKTFSLILSYPPRQLSPNGRYHWAQVARCSKKAKSEGTLLTKVEMQKREIVIDPKNISKVSIKYFFAPPDRRARDDDNLIRMMKPYRDGIAEALGVDDKLFRTQECEFLKPSRPAYVRTDLTIYEAEDDRGK